MIPEKPKRRPRCKWLGRDEDGRPYCEHGPAYKFGQRWGCVKKMRDRQKRYRESQRLCRLPKRRPKCKWLGCNETGRPYCEHGPAHKNGPNWMCRKKAIDRSLRFYYHRGGRERALSEKASEVRRRYKQSEAGRETRRREQEKRIEICGIRFCVGFTEHERKELLNGTTHRP